MSESQSVPIQQIDPPLMLASEGNKNPQGMSNVPTSPPPPYPQQSFTSMPPAQVQPQQQYAQPQYQQPQQPQPQYPQQQPQYQQQQQQYQQPQQQYQQTQYQQQQPVQMQTYPPQQSQPVQVVSESVQVRDVSYTEPAQPSVVYVDQQPQTIVMQPTSLVITSPTPTRTTCTNCGNVITTTVTETPGTTAYILSVILCLLFWPLAWLPCVMSGCLDKIHSCPVCGTVLATVKA